MFAEVTRNTFEIPGGVLVTTDAVRNSLDDQELQERCLRPRPKQILEISVNPSARYVFPRRPIFSGILESLREACVELGQSQKNRYAVWEFHTVYGQVRRGIPTLGKEWEAGNGSQGIVLKTDMEQANWEHPDGIEVPESVGSQQVKSGLRARSLADMDLHADVLANRVASYLGNPPNLEIGWTTSAPATGITPNWNGKEVRVLSWSGHLDTLGLSETAALLEGIERRVGALESEPRSILATGEELDGNVLTPADFPAYPDDFYGELGAAYSASQPHEWVQVTRLHDQEVAWVPREYIYYGQQMKHQLWALSTSSGCATGSTMTEAQLFGVLELIERDSFVGCWYAGIDASPIDLETISGIDALLTRAKLLGIELKCGLLPSIIGIPVVVASAQATDEVGPVLAIGASCHPDLESAVSGAVNEAWTYIDERLAFAQENGDKIQRLHEDPTLCADIEDHPLLAMYPTRAEYLDFVGTGEAMQAQPDPDWARWGSRDAAELLDHIVELLHAEGIDLWVHRQTSRFEQSLGLETVMMVAPGLLPVDFGWKQQRALQSDRLRKIIDKYYGPDAKPRKLPHAFS